MNSQFEHLQLPRTNIELPKRIKGGGGGNKEITVNITVESY